MLSENLNNAVSQISSIMKCCNMDKIGIRCLKISNNRFKNNNSPDDCRIFSYLMQMKNEPLNDRLNLSPRIFKAIDII